ncbi:MAG: general secretion pathway protein GspB [Polaromonas sp.]
MSYILDALKKANAEREHGRGVAPGLHTQPARGMSESHTQNGAARQKRNALLLALVTALFLCAATMGALFWSQLNPPARLAASAPPPAQQPTTNMGNAGNAANTDQPTPTAPQQPLVTVTPPALVRVTPAPHSTPPPAPAAPASPEIPETRPAKPEPITAPTRPRPTAAQPPPPAPTAPPLLPANVRSALPPLVVSGSTYSDNPAYRMLIINGQVYREGEFPAPELKLEQIKQKSALLRYKGSTYLLPY